MSIDTPKEKRKGTGLGWLLARQIISATVFFALVYGMHCSNNPFLNNYAASIGRAIRYEADLQGGANEIITRIKDAFDTASPEESLPDGITFQ